MYSKFVIQSFWESVVSVDYCWQWDTDLGCDYYRLLELAARFSTRLIRSHGIWQRQDFRSNETMLPTSSVQSSYKHLAKAKPVGHVSELARLLVVIRSVQGRLQAKRNGPSRGAKVLCLSCVGVRFP